jgi:hypothetical protein
MDPPSRIPDRLKRLAREPRRHFPLLGATLVTDAAHLLAKLGLAGWTLHAT